MCCFVYAHQGISSVKVPSRLGHLAKSKQITLIIPQQGNECIQTGFIEGFLVASICVQVQIVISKSNFGGLGPNEVQSFSTQKCPPHPSHLLNLSYQRDQTSVSQPSLSHRSGSQSGHIMGLQPQDCQHICMLPATEISKCAPHFQTWWAALAPRSHQH